MEERQSRRGRRRTTERDGRRREGERIGGAGETSERLGSKVVLHLGWRRKRRNEGKISDERNQ